MLQEIKTLVQTLNEQRDAYYNKDSPKMTDKEYDRLFDRLEELEKKSGIIFSNSPTKSVGYYPVSELAKVRHTRALLSLEKTKQIRELADFMENQDTLLMLKLDGLTVKLVYEEGRLVQASTRGDGNVGEDITHNIPAFENVPLSISYRERLVTTGEAFIYKDDFRQLKDTIRDGNGELYKNARNLASGSVRNLNPEVCKGRHVHFIPFNVLEGMDEGTGVDSREFKLMQLGVLGFDTCPYVYMEAGKHSEKELKEQIEKLKTIASEKEIPIDGLVLIYDNLSYSSKCGKTGHHTLTLRTDCLYQENGHYIVRMYQVKTSYYEKPIPDDVAKLIQKSMEYTYERYGETEYVFVNESNPSLPFQYSMLKHRVYTLIHENDICKDNGERMGFATHLFRHCYGMKLVELHLDDAAIAHLLGHRGVNTVYRYRRASGKLLVKETEELRKTMDEILSEIIKEWDGYEQVFQNG